MDKIPLTMNKTLRRVNITIFESWLIMGYIGWGREERVVVGGSRFPLVRPLSFVEEFPYPR